MPKVSVICDNYNYALYIREAVESVLFQTFTDFELIIVDDGSTDNSREIIESFSDKRIIRVYKENGGQTSAFNSGFEAASGEIIAFIDSDDYWYPKKLETIIKAHEQSQIVQHWLSENGLKIYGRTRTDVDWSNALVNYGYIYNHCPTSGLSFARKVLEPFFPLANAEEMRGYSDGCILMLAMTKAKVMCIDEILGFYRVHGKNINANRTDSGEAALNVAVFQRNFTNKQLNRLGQKEIPHDEGQYISYLLSRIDFGNMPVVIYGTGNSGQRVAKVLESRGIVIWGFANSSGTNASSPDELYNRRNEFGKIVIASSLQIEIADTLYSAGFDESQIIGLEI